MKQVHIYFIMYPVCPCILEMADLDHTSNTATKMLRGVGTVSLMIPKDGMYVILNINCYYYA